MCVIVFLFHDILQNYLMYKEAEYLKYKEWKWQNNTINYGQAMPLMVGFLKKYPFVI